MTRYVSIFELVMDGYDKEPKEKEIEEILKELVESSSISLEFECLIKLKEEII
jgi:hypothetical protein